MAKFRVLHGMHVEGGPPDCECERCEHDRNHPTRRRGHIYKKGDIVDSKVDLNIMNSEGAVKFEVITEDQAKAIAAVPAQAVAVPAAAVSEAPEAMEQSDGLDQMTVSELRRFAEEEEVDLGAASRKDDILETIRKAMG